MSVPLGKDDIDEEQLNEFMLAIDNLESSNLIFEELDNHNISTVKTDVSNVVVTDISANTVVTNPKESILQKLIPLSLTKSIFKDSHPRQTHNQDLHLCNQILDVSNSGVELTKPSNEQKDTLSTETPSSQKSHATSQTVVELKPTHSHSDLNKNGWTPRNQSHFQICLHRLKYYRVINNFFFFELKKREGRLSWAIIIFSSFSSVLSLIASDKQLFPYSTVILKWILVLFTLLTTLIGSFIKKQQFIDKINIIDRYLSQLNQTIEDLNITSIIEPDKRDSYDDFCKKYIPIIKNVSVSPASFSPKEWKSIVYRITKYYPELTYVDGSEQERLWPWYFMHSPRKESGFGKMVIDSYKYLNKNTLFSPDYNNVV